MARTGLMASPYYFPGQGSVSTMVAFGLSEFPHVAVREDKKAPDLCRCDAGHGLLGDVSSLCADPGFRVERGAGLESLWERA